MPKPPSKAGRPILQFGKKPKPAVKAGRPILQFGKKPKPAVKAGRPILQFGSLATRFDFLKKWLEPLSLFVGWRIGLAIAVIFAGIFLPTTARRSTAPYGVDGLGRWADRLVGAWTHWDGEWFLYVAQVGYKPGDTTSPFFPLYPTAVRFVSIFTAGNYPLAGILVSLIAGLATFILFFQLVQHDFGLETGRLALLYLAVFPTSFYLAACYSEGVFLALAIGAFYAARCKANWGMAGLLIGLAGVSRNQGILLLIPLGLEWWASHRAIVTKHGLRQVPLYSLAFWVLPFGFLGSWLLFNLIVLGDPINFVTVQSSPVWNRASAWPWQTVADAVQLFFSARGTDGFLPSGYQEDPNLFDFPFLVLMLIIFVGSIVLVLRKQMPFSYLLYFAIAIFLPLFSPAAKEPLLSYPRFALLAFPAFITLAWFGLRLRLVHYAYLLSATLLLGLLVARFSNWFWVA